MPTQRHALLVTVLLALAGCHPPALAPTPAGAEMLRVVTYNIHAGHDAHGEPSMDRLAALIDSLGADVVLLQEVDRGTARSGEVDQLQVLAEATGMHGFFAKAIDFDGGEYGNALLSRHPLRETAAIPLPVEVPEELADRYYEARVLLHAVVETPAGPVHVLNTHLDHHADPVFRHPQFFRMLAHLAAAVPPGAPVILGGDLNAEPDAAEIRALRLELRDAWAECGEGPGFTFRADDPHRRIDYLWTRGLACTAAEVVPTLVSDHRPLVAELRPAP
jgi:endonuclease/exonuclease/phosphatase family metal-dependent hydrolase